MGDDLRREAILFGTYLVDRPPSEELIERYCRANHELFAGEGDEDRAVLAFAREYPWSVPMLDAAAGLTGQAPLLRKKLLVMTAILETTPDHVAQTEQQSVGLARLAWRLGTAGAKTAVHAATGLALIAALRRRG
jgi:hypothetical protein